MTNAPYPIVRFGDVARQVTDSTQNPIEDGFELYIGLEHLDPESLKIRRWGLIEETEITFTRVFRAGQVLFGRRRAYQRKAALAEFDGICSGDIIVMEAIPDRLLPELLPFIVQTEGFYEYALSTSAGSLSPRTKWSALAKYEFPLPPLDEQRRIAEILWAVEDAIDSYFDVYTQADLTNRVNVSHLYLRGAKNNYAGLRQTSLGEIPSHWQIVSLEQVTSKIVDGVHKTPNYVDTGVPFITVENLTRGQGIDFSDTRFVSVDDHESFKKRANPEKGDVLVSKDGTLGIARLIETDREFSIFVSVALLKPKHDVIDGRYLKSFFDSSAFKKRLLSKTSGSALKHIHLVDFRSALIPLPSLEEQLQIISLVELSHSAVNRVSAHISKLMNLKRSMLAELVENYSQV